jgi:hypothetical protein
MSHRIKKEMALIEVRGVPFISLIALTSPSTVGGRRRRRCRRWSAKACRGESLNDITKRLPIAHSLADVIVV